MDNLPLPGPQIKRGVSAQILRRDWPAVHKACINTYWNYDTFSRLSADMKCPAGYVLHGCLKGAEVFQANHQHRLMVLKDAVSEQASLHKMLDQPFANEIWWQFRRHPIPNKPAAWIWKCLVNLSIERPEKILPKR